MLCILVIKAAKDRDMPPKCPINRNSIDNSRANSLGIMKAASDVADSLNLSATHFSRNDSEGNVFTFDRALHLGAMDQCWVSRTIGNGVTDHRADI
jgi:hypothetical protein